MPKSTMVGKVYVDGVRDEKLRTLFDQVLRKLADEFVQLFQRTEWARQYLFEYNERVLIGLFNNALIRHNDEVSTFQEYQVYKSNDHFVGRADLLVIHNDFELLIEAKKWDYDGKDYKDVSGIFKGPREQINRYCEAERSDFKEQVYLSVLIFEYVSKKYLGEIKKQYTQNTMPEEGVEFDAFYATEHNGLMVYGQVFEPSASAT